MHTARAATGEGNAKIALQATREVTRIINLLTKQDFELDPEMVYCLLRSHEWVGYHGLLPADSEVIPKTRQTMAENLFTPCPEPDSNQDLDPELKLDTFFAPEPPRKPYTAKGKPETVKGKSRGKKAGNYREKQFF